MLELKWKAIPKERVIFNCVIHYSTTPWFSQTSTYMRDTLHWLPVEKQILFNVVPHGPDSERCLGSRLYLGLCELLRPVSNCPGRWRLRSASHGELMQPDGRPLLSHFKRFPLKQSVIEHTIISRPILDSSGYVVCSTRLFGNSSTSVW